jgi:WD40 repeat protein
MSLSITKIATLTAHTGSIYSLYANNKIPQTFYSAGGDGNLIKWDLNDLDKAYLVSKVDTNIFSMNALPMQSKILLGQMQGGIHVLDIEQKNEVKHLSFHKSGIYDIQVIDNGNAFIAAGGDGILSLWSANNFLLLKKKDISEKSIRCLIVDEENLKIYAGCSDNFIYVLHYKTLEVIHKWQAHQNSVFSLQLSPNGKYLLSGSRDAHLSVWTIDENYRLLLSQPAHLFTINDIVFQPEGKLFATAGRDKHIKIWDSTNFNLLKVIDKEKCDGHVNSVNKLLWSDYLISCSDDRSIMVWDINE